MTATTTWNARQHAQYSAATQTAIRRTCSTVGLRHDSDSRIDLNEEQPLVGGNPLDGRQEFLGELLAHVREVMTAALAVGGTSFDSLYVNVNGESGYFERDLDAYGREGEPCRRCGTPMRRRPWMNRSSYYCPRCQRTPRR